MAEVTKPVALNESLNTTDSTPKNIADVLKDKLGDIANAISGGGGGSGGHTIQNASGANMPQETTMQFTDSHVTDNSQAGKTEVEVIKSVASADYSSETEDGLYLIPDGDGSVIEPASEDYVEVTADGNTTYAQLLKNLNADVTKITNLAVISVGGQLFNVAYDGSEFWFTRSFIDGNTQKMSLDRLRRMSNGNWSCITIDTSNTMTDQSSLLIPQGTKITLYYGNKKAVVDLQTTANRCLYDSNTTVKQKIDGLTNQVKTYSRSTPNLESTTQFTLKTSDSYNQIYTIMGVGSSGTTSITICNAQGTTLSNLTDKAITKVSFADDILTLSLPSSWYRLIVFSNYPFTLNY